MFGCYLAESLLADALAKSEDVQAGMSILQEEVGKSLIDKVVVQVAEGEVVGDKEALEGEEEFEGEEEQEEEGSSEEKGSDGVNSVVARTTGTEVASSETETRTKSETVASSQRVSKTSETLVVAQEVSSQTVSVTKEEVKSPLKPAVQISDNGGKEVVTNKTLKNENSNNQRKSNSSWWWSWLFSTSWNYEW
ncbi:hypothetical protein [Borrelia venezuelensis]|uniref:hypothetical protein n=1 Tax=Borrelia venezuelensis TaxID=1653839 RepID=UPI001FF68525|nr:hypothetical protein [Borrelia venezuelensis]UPA12667.1 hypothetical protein bvRMA01_001001 [Borrelia venezuelensis]